MVEAKKDALAIGGGERLRGALGRPEQLVFGARSVPAQDLLVLLHIGSAELKSGELGGRYSHRAPLGFRTPLEVFSKPSCLWQGALAA